MPGQPAKRVTPSDLARYFFHDCERFLRFRTATPEERSANGLPDAEFDSTPLMRSVTESGFAWEEQVLGRLLAGRAIIAPAACPLRQRRHSLSETLLHLKMAQPGQFIYQGTLRAAPAFYSRYGLDPARLTFPDNHPDLISVIEGAEGQRLLRVIDVKRGDSLQLAHRIQVLLYALELDALLTSEGIAGTAVDLTRGAVWLGGHDAPETFDIASLRPHLEGFLKNSLSILLERAPDSACWHLHYRCEWCDYLGHCRSEMVAIDDLSRLTGLTGQGKRHLHQLGVRTVSELGGYLASPGADEGLAVSASLAGRKHYLANKVEAFRISAPVGQGTGMHAVPLNESVAVFVTLQQEPVSRTVYLAGILVHAKRELQQAVFDPPTRSKLFAADGTAIPWVTLAEAPHLVPARRQEFVTILADVLTQVHAYNAGRDWKNQFSLQVYVHTERDRALLTECLLASLHEPHARVAMRLLLQFHGPDLMLTEDRPEQTLPYPVTTLLSALGALLALPVDISYTLPEALAALGSTHRYDRDEYIHYPMGHGLRADAIHAAWHLGEAGATESVKSAAQAYLRAVRALLWAIRDRAGEQLTAWAPKFQLPELSSIADPVLSKLAFFCRYEALLACLSLREQRAEATEVQLALGTAARFVAVDGYQVQSDGQTLLEVEQEEFPGWLLVRDNAPGRKAQMQFSDARYRNFPSRANFGPRTAPDLAIVGVRALSLDALGYPQGITFKAAKGFDNGPPARGERFLLHPRFQDYNTDRIVSYLEACDSEGGGLYQDFLRDPEQAASLVPLPNEVERRTLSLLASLGLTASQTQAFRELRRRRVLAVWGPPGTGKTHFLATAIVALAEAYDRAGMPFRVLVTAFTHNAIENVLRKLAERQRDTGLAGGLAVCKLKKWQTAGEAPVPVVDDAAAASWVLGKSALAIGATVYSCIKAQQSAGWPQFDLVIVDEASQVRVPEAAVPFRAVGPRGRLVLAGDHLQLPPIVQGVYPEPPGGERLLHRSIFEAAQGAVGGGSPVVQMLLENRRMNDVLTRVSAELVYGPDYTCFDQRIASRRLRYSGSPANSQLVSACLDPAYPLVVVTLEGVRAGGENLVEARLVADLVIALREGLPYSDDASFFSKGVFVVSPHRAQNRAIRRELVNRRTWAATPFVDTVDKMQGQEAEAVIVSYGVADPEYAQMEAEFIYSLNRLNVAMTRAQTKCVICLPQPLLDAPPQVLEMPEAARGLGFMQNLVRRLDSTSHTLTFLLGDGVTVHVRRADR